MGGPAADTEWTILVQSVQAFLAELAADSSLRNTVRISAVAYDDESDKVFLEAEPSRALMDRIAFTGGGTDFEKPLKHALEYIQEAKGIYQNYEVFFFTDGSAPYPRAAMSEWLRSPAITKATDLRAVGYGDGDFSVLERMAAEFEANAASGTFR